MATLHTSGYVWWVERGKLAVGISSNNGETVSGPSDAGDTIRIYGKEVVPVDNGSGTDLAEFSSGTSLNLAEFSKLPEQFHEALIARVNEKLYRKDVEGLQISQYWGAVYKDYVLRGKKYANMRRQDSGFTVAQHDM